MASIEHDRLTSAEPKADDKAFDRAIRPTTRPLIARFGLRPWPIIVANRLLRSR